MQAADFAEAMKHKGGVTGIQGASAAGGTKSNKVAANFPGQGYIKAPAD